MLVGLTLILSSVGLDKDVKQLQSVFIFIDSQHLHSKDFEFKNFTLAFIQHLDLKL